MGLSTIEFTGSGSGYTIINFVIIYLIGCYIRNNNTKYKFSRLLRLMILNLILIFLWALSERLCLYSWGDVSWSYCNPLVIFEAVLIFLIFKQINIIRLFKNRNKINIENDDKYLINSAMYENDILGMIYRFDELDKYKKIKILSLIISSGVYLELFRIYNRLYSHIAKLR